MCHWSDPRDVRDFVQREVRRCEAERTGATRKARSDSRHPTALFVAPIHSSSGGCTPFDISTISAFSSRAYAQDLDQ